MANMAQAARSLWRDLAPALLLMVLGLGALGVAKLLDGTGSGQFLVVMAPGVPPHDTIVRVALAGGGVIDFGGLSNVVIAGATDAGFADRLRAAGAWLVVATPALAGCLGSDRTGTWP